MLLPRRARKESAARIPAYSHKSRSGGNWLSAHQGTCSLCPCYGGPTAPEARLCQASAQRICRVCRCRRTRGGSNCTRCDNNGPRKRQALRTSSIIPVSVSASVSVLGRPRRRSPNSRIGWAVVQEVIKKDSNSEPRNDAGQIYNFRTYCQRLVWQLGSDYTPKTNEGPNIHNPSAVLLA